MSKEKQIDEMAKIIDDNHGFIVSSVETAEALYNAGYRKQSVGEWETIPDYQPDKFISYRYICSVCKTTYKDIRPHGHKYCHECGAHMKEGAE